MSVISSALDIAGFLQERKRYKTEQEREEEKWRLKEQQIKQSIGLWAPGREEKTGFTGSLPYTVKGKEPGLKRQRLQTEIEMGRKTLEPGMTPEEKLKLWKEEKNYLHRHRLEEIEAGKTGREEEEMVPFDESGGFNIRRGN